MHNDVPSASHLVFTSNGSSLPRLHHSRDGTVCSLVNRTAQATPLCESRGPIRMRRCHAHLDIWPRSAVQSSARTRITQSCFLSHHRPTERCLQSTVRRRWTVATNRAFACQPDHCRPSTSRLRSPGRWHGRPAWRPGAHAGAGMRSQDTITSSARPFPDADRAALQARPFRRLDERARSPS
jgi:hypothetical protein